MKISYFKLKQTIPGDMFSDSQWENLRMLNGKTYIHNWQLEEDLANLSPEWRFKPKTNKNQLFNNSLQKKIKTIESICKTYQEAPADSLM